jgi:isoleucyl-tRNA synthetase
LRKRNDLRVRQPLGVVTIVTRDPALVAAVETHRDLIAEELNVHRVEVGADEADLVELSAKADFKRLGPRLGKDTGPVAASIAALDHAQVTGLLDGGALTVNGVALTADDIVVARTPREGTVVASEAGITVALDTTLSDDLRAEGLARELVNRIQLLRRAEGFAVTDRIKVFWASDDDDIIAAFAQYGSFIAGEVLALVISRAHTETAGTDIDGRIVRLRIAPT